MINHERRFDYYKLLIQPQLEADAVANFLNLPEILHKWTDEDRTWFTEQWLKDHGWVEIDEPAINDEVIVFESNVPTQEVPDK